LRRVVSLNSLSLNLWRAVRNLYMRDPITHIYIMYDLIYELREY